ARERRYFERRLGASLGGVRVHAESGVATRLGARAVAAGRDIAFAPGEWQPQRAGGRRLLGHELAHVVQQGEHGTAVQLQEEKKPEEGADALEEGMKKVASEAAKNEKVKKEVLEPAKRYALSQWSQLSTGEKAGVIGFGAGTYGLAIGAGLSDPAGRKLLSDFNLVAPLGLIPYATLSDFRFVLPKDEAGPTLFKASFSGDDLLGLAHDRIGWWPKMTLSLDFTWSMDAAGEVSLAGAKANWGLLPGINLQAGTGIGLGWKPLPIPQAEPFGPDLRGPFATGPATLQGTGVFLSVDLLRAPILPEAVRRALGAGTGKD
uniref:eCIS core domain-containing protein n=1 Tax=Falsiroseomonas oryzae TaxID=2766473 RepID=UPI0022EB47DD